MTTGREEYNLNVPPDFFAVNINFGYQQVEPAAALGTVFQDTNGNGRKDEGESGLAGVVLEFTHDETRALSTVTTEADGRYRFQAGSVINHRVQVDESTLPFTGQLTTGREEYNLNIPPNYFAPNINFGYQEVQPSAATGIVFEDRNQNGNQDEGESGIPDVTLEITLRESGRTILIQTNGAGIFRFESALRRFDIQVDTDTLPYAEPVLTTSREVYSLNIPNGFYAPNINFGYRPARPGERPPLLVGGSSSSSRPYPFPPEGKPDDGDSLADPLVDPDPQLPLPDDLPADAGEYALPREGVWTVYNGPLTMDCSGMSFDTPASPPEGVSIRLEDGGQTLVGTGFEGGTNRLQASGNVRGLYTGKITITQDGISVEMDFFLQVLTPQRAAGYLTGQANAQGVSCQAYRPFTMQYNGG